MWIELKYRKSIDIWNYFTKQIKEILSRISRDKLKKQITAGLVPRWWWVSFTEGTNFTKHFL